MTNRSTSRRPASRAATSSRAEARRRARLAALEYDGNGENGENETEAEPAPRAAGPGMLQRLFPAAPPLKGKGDPLAGFSYQGPFRSIVTYGYLLAQNPVAWIAPGLVYVLSWEAIWLSRDAGSIVLLLVQLSQYLVLAAAGWFGWQRPWVFGAAAGLVGAIGATLLSLFLAASAGVDVSLNPADANLYLQLLFYVFLGAALGWYGGYLRRRLGTPQPSAGGGSRRR